MKKIKCNCSHEAQDGWMGEGIRAHNKTMKGSDSTTLYRCTVCGTERTLPQRAK